MGRKGFSAGSAVPLSRQGAAQTPGSATRHASLRANRSPGVLARTVLIAVRDRREPPSPAGPPQAARALVVRALLSGTRTLRRARVSERGVSARRGDGAGGVGAAGRRVPRVDRQL